MSPRPALYAEIAAPPDRFYADPFPVELGTRSFVLFEDYRYTVGKAHISAVEVQGPEEFSPPFAVLQRAYHLSYPFCFWWSGALWMIPESAACEQVQLFRAVQFPGSWKRERVLLSGIRAFDPTLIQHEGRFWLFLTVAGAHGPDRDLHLFHAEAPTGPWTPHSANPIVSDLRRARPAGTIFSADGGLLRPGQDSSVMYGRSIVLSRITALNLRSYAETPIARIGPRWLPGATGTHTLSRSPHLEVIDWRTRRRLPP